jgi:predicted  nucleic acid-binding Zn-ribbon protein
LGKSYIQLNYFVFVMQGLMVSKTLKIQKEKEEYELSKLQDKVEKIQKSLEEKETKVISLKEKVAEAKREKEEAVKVRNVDMTKMKEQNKSINEL